MRIEPEFTGRAAVGAEPVEPSATLAADPAGHDWTGQVGGTGFITLVTAVNRLGAIWLPVLYRVTRRFPGILGIAPMRSVHITHWSLLKRIPYNGPPQIRERPARPYLLWGTMFNGASDPYIEGFVVQVWRKIRANWGTSYGFPTRPSTAQVAHYIDEHTVPGSYTYAAYPEAGVRMICSAQRIAVEHRYLSRAAVTADPEAFARIYRGFLARSQADL